MPLRTLPPAGTSIRGNELGRWLLRALKPSGELASLRSRLADLHGVKDVFLLSSGRAAMARLLREMASLGRPSGEDRKGDRDEVLVPGYTCYSVAASAVRAGLRVRPVDVDPGTLDYSKEALSRVDSRRVLALVSSNLFGIPNDLPYLETFAGDRDLWMVDDAAQALHAQLGGRGVGTFGHAGLFSFDKGKNITTVQGGVLVSRHTELSLRLRDSLGDLPRPPAGQVAADMTKLAAYAILLHPRLYWLPHRILPLGRTPWDTSYPVQGYSSRLAPMAHLLLDRLEEISEGRIQRARHLTTALHSSSISGTVGMPMAHPPEEKGHRPVFLRFPLLLPDPEHREEALRLLDEAGLGGSASYPRALLDVPELQPFLAPGVEDTPGARLVAERLLTLPTHAYVTDGDVGRMVETLERAASHPPRSTSTTRGGVRLSGGALP